MSRLTNIMNKKDFEIEVVSLKDKVFRFARFLLKSVDDAEDLTQDIFEKLWTKRTELLKYDNIESFVIQSTKNLCFDRIKHKNVVLNSSAEIKLSRETLTEPETERAETSELIKKAMDLLPEKQRIIMHLRDVEGYEFNEIAEITGAEASTIRVNLSRARKAVKEKIVKEMSYGL